MSIDADGEGRTALIVSMRVGDPIYFCAGKFKQAGQKFFDQAALVPMDGFMRGENGVTAGADGRVNAASEVGEVFDTGGDASDAFVVERAPFPAVGNFVGVGADFIRMQAREMFPYKTPMCGPKNL